MVCASDHAEPFLTASKALASSQRVDAVVGLNVEFALEDARTVWVVSHQSAGKRGRSFVSAVEESRAEPMQRYCRVKWQAHTVLIELC